MRPEELRPTWRLDATETARRIREGKLDPAAHLRETLRRITRLDQQLNAVVARIDEDDVGQRLEQVDWDAPFAGVPFLVKETTPYPNLRLTYGSRWLQDHIAVDKDPLIQAFEKIGFVVVGVSNAPEFGLTDVTEPLLLGATRNPWNLARSPGGSSGGAAAAVAAGLVPFAHGTDGGGSLRAPASHCGVFALKPSRGRPFATPSLPGAEWLPDLVSRFGLTRSVRDAQGILAALSKMSGYEMPPKVGQRHDNHYRIAATGIPLHAGDIDPAVARVYDAAVAHCRDLGHSVTTLEWPFDAHAMHTAFFGAWAGFAKAYIEFISQRLQRPIERLKLEPWTVGLLDIADALTGKERIRISSILHDAQIAHNDLFGDFDLLLTPVYAKPPPQIGEHHTSLPFHTVYKRVTRAVAFTPIQNVAGAPAVSVPFAVSDADLPIGVQFAAAPGQDEMLLQFASAVQASRPWPKFAPGATN
ncbi:MAG: amidase [Chromatiales bacterium]|nr:amidase [Chromatiales bacterium]MYC52200.1 amidase [Gammaproteobacteria bacterium]